MTLPLTSPDDETQQQQQPMQIDTPIDLRPNLGDIGIEEIERGLCEDNFENRRILRNAKMQWLAVFSSNGHPTNLIQAISEDMRTKASMYSLNMKKAILTQPKDLNSDYITGYELISDPDADGIVPPWVLGSTRMWCTEQDIPVASETKAPTSLPHRCRLVKADGIRCLLWSSGRPKNNGLCNVHLRSTKNLSTPDLERARAKIMQAATYAVDVVEELMESAVSEPVRLKAATEILDRAGLRGGTEIDISGDIAIGHSPAEIIATRLEQLKKNATRVAEISSTPNVEVEEAEVIDE